MGGAHQYRHSSSKRCGDSPALMKSYPDAECIDTFMHGYVSSRSGRTMWTKCESYDFGQESGILVQDLA